MIVILNGAFGVGKTTVGRLLKKQIPGSRLYNPEWAGSVLMRLPPFIKLRGAGTDDFQNIALWRKSVVRGTKIFRVLSGGAVIVPMAFCRTDYFDEIVRGIRGFDDEIRIFCLKASLETILKRLEQRGERLESRNGVWTIRRARECVEAHADSSFGEPMDTEKRNAAEVAEEILRRLKSPNNPPEE